MADLADLLANDFGPFNLFTAVQLVLPDGSQHVTRINAHLDHEANSVFLSCYLPDQRDPGAVIRAVWRERGVVGVAREMNIEYRHAHTVPATSSSDLSFTGRVWIYFDGLMDDSEAALLTAEAKVEGVFLVIRDRRYAEARAVMSNPVAFMCHDSRDKATVAVPLTRALRHLGVSVWLDEEQLVPGDSLRERVEQAIRDAKKLIILATPNFLANRRWAVEEYSAAFALEKVRGVRVILPVWCGVTDQEIAAQAPFLLDRVAAPWDGDPEKTARVLAKACRG